ncbi:flagellar hook-length control protein FliK [Oscillospiraceae bacterium 50-58]
MNVTDQWMLDRMQQMAANLAASMPQVGQNADTSKPEKSDSFKDLMDKAKDQRVESPKKDSSVKKSDSVEKKEPAQTVQKTQKTVQTDPATGLRQIDVTPEEAALLVAGYAKLSPPMEDGTVWMVTVQDANGNPVLPLAEQEGLNGAAFLGTDGLITQGEWVLDEITPEFTQALEQLLQKTGDSRSAESIIGMLEEKMGDAQFAPSMELAVKNDDQDDASLDASVMADQPLFKDVKAAPVKVGENFQLDTQQPDMDDNLADTIRFAAQQGLRQMEIKLSPENLGSLTVKLTQATDGTLQVVLHAANAKAANLLNQHIDNLNAALQGYSQNSEVHVEVQRGEDSQQAQQQQQQQTDPNGHNRQQQEQQKQQESGHSGDFIQKLRLGLFSLDDVD